MKRVLIAAIACLLAFPCFSQTSIENAFAPEAGAEALVLKTIDSARRSIRMAAYSFTSPQVMRKLLDAKKRGVDIQIVIDEKGNKSKASRAAMNLVTNAGIPLRTISTYPIHHDKYIVVDDMHVETGSFNYSQAAARRNSENVIVVWNNSDLAASYLNHWQSRWNQGVEWRPEY